MALEVENVDYAFPDGLALECLFDGHRLDERGCAAVLGFNSLSELFGVYVHARKLSMNLGLPARSLRTEHLLSTPITDPFRLNLLLIGV